MLFSTLQATTQAAQPVHLSKSITIPQRGIDRFLSFGIVVINQIIYLWTLPPLAGGRKGGVRKSRKAQNTPP